MLVNVDFEQLNERQQRWLELYLNDPQRTRFNATQAAIAAGYSARSARNQGSRLLHHPVISRAIEEDFLTKLRRIEAEFNVSLPRMGARS